MSEHIKKKVNIYTECLNSTGFGHLGRCTALAEMILEAGHEVEIILMTDGTSLKLQPGISIRVLNWMNRKILTDFLNFENPSTSFVDSYLAEPGNYETISEKSKKIICIDDTNRIDYPEKALILNPGLGGEYVNYDRNRNVILTGIEYVFLRKPFRVSFEFPKIQEKVSSILITLGGNDHWNLVPKILDLLADLRPGWKKEIVIGNSTSNMKEIESRLDANSKLYRGIDAVEMRRIMLSVDFAIVAGGQTTYELAKCGIPMILVETAENQTYNIRAWTNLCKIYSITAKDVISKDGLNHLSDLIDQLQEKSYREQLSMQLRSLFMGNETNGILQYV